ncbi:diguanylate cyclase [Terriglobus saanensis]|uniref:diguanylate cyclase n=1 Tax=Terriglobus saanensis (strain ATCC BAA-1853 / DSM 23119 / SP1PR4) TaxID=401053 RepID=E8V2T6_TERSS|nr:diguanylate cyclase [Terriglobus saanensis]ADV84633.1 diguanylate cyclase [Terriglobus saanensis SP1PR4]
MDRHTVFTMQAVMLIFLSLILAVCFRSQRREREDKGPYWLAAGFFLGGLGLLLQAERGLITPVLAILVGNGLFLLLSTFMNRGLAETTGQGKGQFYYMLALSAATVANFWYYTWIKPDVLLRVIEAAIVILVMHAVTAIMLLRSKDPVTRPAVRMMATFLLMHAFGSVLRVTVAWRLHQADAWFTWTGTMSIIGLALCFLWMEGLRQTADLKYRAMTDSLTGLFNRHGLDMLSVPELDLAARYNWPCSALMMDVNHFKEINDRRGHAAGDLALSSIAGILKSTLRTSDLATRVGGDEFFVLLPNADANTTAIVVARIRVALKSLILQGPTGAAFSVSASIGTVTMPGRTTSLGELLRESDEALYREKFGRTGVSQARMGSGASTQVQTSLG